MREFKKVFFETLIQLTILASVFRQNSDDSLNNNNNNNNIDHYFQPAAASSYGSLRNTSLAGDIDLLLLNENSNYLRYHQANLNNSNNYSSSHFGDAGSDLVHRNHLLKEQENLSDLKFIQRFNRLLSSSRSPTSASSSRHLIKPPVDPSANQHLFPPNNYLFVAPATFQNTNNNHKELQFELTEAENRLLLDLNANSNLNSFSKEDIFEMEVDIQKIIEQDIDIGITKDFYLDFDSNADSYFDQPNDGITWKKGGQDLAKTLLEKQKDTDLISLTSIFEQQYVPEGYRLVVEEDTGEWILTVLPTDNSTENTPTESPHVEQINKTSTAHFFNSSSSSPKQQMRKLVNHSKSVDDDDDETGLEAQDDNSNDLFNIKVKFSIFEDQATLHQNIANEVEQSMARHALREAERRRLSSTYSPSSNESVIKPLHLDAELLRQTSVDPELLKMFDEANMLTSDFQFDSTSSINQSQLVSFEQADQVNPPGNGNSSYLPISSAGNQSQQMMAAYQSPLEETTSFPNGLKANVSMQPADMTISYDFLASFENNLQNIPSPVAEQSDSDQSDSNIDFNLESFDAYLEQAIKGGDLMSQRQSSNDLASSHDGFDINEIFKMIEETANNFNISNDLNPKSRVANLSASSLLTTTTTSSNNDAVHHESAKSYDSLTLKQEAREQEDEVKPDLVGLDRSTILRGFEHNHTYLFGSPSQDENNSENFRQLHPYSYKNKLKKLRNQNRSMDNSNLTRQQESRDELLLRENQVHITLDQIVNTDADQFNELLRVHALTAEQTNIVKDIRRRGKNKVAAQICRKRKIDSIDSLREDVGELREEKKHLQSEFASIEAQIKKMTMKFDELYKDLIGNQYDKNDPIMICMTNLKDQLNMNNNPIVSTLNNSMSEDDDLDDYEDEDEDEDDEEEELDDEDDLDEEEFSDDLAYSFGPATTAKKPLAKALSNNRKISKPNPAVLSPPTTNASNSSMPAYEPSTSKPKRAKKN